MNTEKRLTRAELVEEIRSALGTWSPALSKPAGEGSLRMDAGLADVVDQLQVLVAAPGVPASVTRQLRRAAESAALALDTDGSNAYGHLGMAYAYVLQARRAAEESPFEGPAGPAR